MSDGKLVRCHPGGWHSVLRGTAGSPGQVRLERRGDRLHLCPRLRLEDKCYVTMHVGLGVYCLRRSLTWSRRIFVLC